MGVDTNLSTLSSQSSPLDSLTNQLLRQARSASASVSSAKTSSSTAPLTTEDAKIEKAGKDFESILLGSWLQQAEQSFAKVPGGDDEEEEDPGSGQFQGIAMQALAGSLTKSGGIGIAKMISDHLRSATHAEKPSTEPAGKSADPSPKT